MMNGGGAASPPARKQHDDKTQTLDKLLKFYEDGVFSREEIRAMVYKEMKMKMPHQGEVVEAAAPKAVPRRKIAPVPAASPSVGVPAVHNKANSRNKPPVSQQKQLRDLVKNHTRRRYFGECCKELSPLWFQTKGGKQMMHRLLFDRAVKDVVDLLYKEKPGPLHKVEEPELKKAIRWQVGRDRNNWCNKKPVRPPYSGACLPFDFETTLATIHESLANAEDLTVSTPKPKVKKAVARRVKFEPPVVVNKNKPIRPCLTCRTDVWTGKVEDCPPEIQVAHPLGTDWNNTPGAEPYCQKHWDEEQGLMEVMGGQHCAVGAKRKGEEANAAPPRKKPTPKKQTRKKPAPKKRTRKKRTRKKPAPKKQAPEKPAPKKIKRWQVVFLLLLIK